MLRESQLTGEQEKLFNDNLKRVDYLVNKYRGRLDSDDLKSKGMEALFYVSQSWDPNKGSFTGYLDAALRNVVSDMVGEKTKGLGMMPYPQQKDLQQRLEELENVLDMVKKDPSQFLPEEVEDLEDQVQLIREELSKKNVPKSVSLQSPLSDSEDGDLAMLDIIEDMKAVSEHDMATYNYLKEQIRKSLSPRDYRIFELAEEGYSNQQIADRIKGQFLNEKQIATGEGISATLTPVILPLVKTLLEQEDELLQAVS